MDQQAPLTPPPVVNPAPVPQAPAPVPSKGTPVWAWILGGCLGIIILGMLITGGLTWWAAKKIKNEFRNAQPNLERWKENAEEMEKEAKKWQIEMEKIQDQMPEVPEQE